MTKSEAATGLQALRKTRRGGPKAKCDCGECRACKVRAKRAQNPQYSRGKAAPRYEIRVWHSGPSPFGDLTHEARSKGECEQLLAEFTDLDLVRVNLAGNILHEVEIVLDNQGRARLGQVLPRS